VAVVADAAVVVADPAAAVDVADRVAAAVVVVAVEIVAAIAAAMSRASNHPSFVSIAVPRSSRAAVPSASAPWSSSAIGYGKANEVPMAVEKATKDARKQMFKVNLKGTTIPHTAQGRYGASSVTLVPARPGTGVTAGKSVRPVLELSGITDILSKAYGSTSPKNLVKATIGALRSLKIREQVEQARGVTLPKGAGELATA